MCAYIPQIGSKLAGKLKSDFSLASVRLMGIIVAKCLFHKAHNGGEEGKIVSFFNMIINALRGLTKCPWIRTYQIRAQSIKGGHVTCRLFKDKNTVSHDTDKILIKSPVGNLATIEIYRQD